MSKSLPKGPRWPRSVQLWLYGRDTAGFLESCRRKHGRCFTMRLPFQRPFVVLSDARAIKQLLDLPAEQTPPYPANAFIESIFGSTSLLFQSGPPHRRDRQLLNEFLCHEKVATYHDEIREETLRFLGRLGLRSDLPLYDWLYRLSLRIALRLFWGIRDDEMLDLIESTVQASREHYASFTNMALDSWAIGRSVHPLCRFVGRTCRSSRYEQLRQEFRSQLKRCSETMVEQADDYPDCPLKTYYLGRVNGIRDERELQLAFDDYVAFSMTLLIAAYDPPAAVTTWLLSELAQSPQRQEEVREEVSGPPTRNASFLSACVDETMRLYPPLHSITRCLTKPARILDFDLPAGSFVLPSIYLLQRDPRHWDSPAEFRPERFLNEPATRTLENGYMPFGGGNRTCPGKHFATLVIRIIAAELIARFSLSSLSHDPPRPTTLGPTLTPPETLAIRLTALSPSAAE